VIAMGLWMVVDGWWLWRHPERMHPGHWRYALVRKQL
jgi:hypothetical protein